MLYVPVPGIPSLSSPNAALSSCGCPLSAWSSLAPRPSNQLGCCRLSPSPLSLPCSQDAAELRVQDIPKSHGGIIAVSQSGETRDTLKGEQESQVLCAYSSSTWSHCFGWGSRPKRRCHWVNLHPMYYSMVLVLPSACNLRSVPSLVLFPPSPPPSLRPMYLPAVVPVDRLCPWHVRFRSRRRRRKQKQP